LSGGTTPQTAVTIESAGTGIAIILFGFVIIIVAYN